jgi:hypothetical protein
VGLNIDTPWTAAATVVTDLIDRFVPDKAEAAKEKLAAAEALQAAQAGQIAASVAIDQAQAATNNIEAASASWWNSGWRPYIGWGVRHITRHVLHPLLPGRCDRLGSPGMGNQVAAGAAGSRHH